MLRVEAGGAADDFQCLGDGGGEQGHSFPIVDFAAQEGVGGFPAVGFGLEGGVVGGFGGDDGVAEGDLRGAGGGGGGDLAGGQREEGALGDDFSFEVEQPGAVVAFGFRNEVSSHSFSAFSLGKGDDGG